MHEEKQILREALTYCVGSVVDPLDLEKAPSLGIYTPRHTDTSYTHRMTFFFSIVEAMTELSVPYSSSFLHK